MKKRTAVVIIVIILSVVAYVGYRANKKVPLEYTGDKVKRGDVVQTVSATGAVEAAEKIELKFMSAERIKKVNVKIGDTVREGDVLAKLDTSKLDAQLLQSRAELSVAQANLQTVIDGSTDEQVKVSVTTVENAQIALASANQNLSDTKVSTQKDIESAQASVNSAQVSLTSANTSLANVKTSNSSSLDNAYEAAWDEVVSSLASCDDALNANTTVLEDEDAEKTLGVTNSQTVRDSDISKNVAQNAYDAALAFKNSVAGNRTEANIDKAIDNAQNALEKTRVTLSDTFEILQATVISARLSQVKLDALKTNISNSRNSINGTIVTLTAKEQAISNQKLANQNSLTSAESSVSSSQSALAVSESNLSSVKSTAESKINSAQNTIFEREGDLKKAQDSLNEVSAKTPSSKILSSQAQVEQERAGMELIQNQINDMILTAPHDGVITALNGEAGEISSMSDPFATMIIPDGFEIKANISEVEISKIKIGDTVDITFDALGSDEKFTGEISKIDPAETVVSGVIYYKVTTLFTGDGNVVKPGMTANLDILTAKKESVLNIPFQALKEKDGYKYVQVVVNNEVKEIRVEVGLKGDSEYEVTKGLNEGQEVVTFLNEENK